jgi:hypothetical protein
VDVKVPRSLAQVLAIATLGVCLSAQTPQPPASPFRAGADLVEVDVSVRDKSGHFVDDLSVDDFELRDEGHPQQVQQLYLRLTTSSGWTNRADPSGSGRESAPPAAAATAVSTVLRPPDLFMVVFDDAHLTTSGFKKTHAAALNLFTKQFRAGDFGGVIANGHIVNNRVSSDRDELMFDGRKTVLLVSGPRGTRA